MLIRHSVIYFFGKLAPAIFSLIGIMIFTRMVPPETYGLFSLITVLAGLVNIFFFQWIRSSFIRFYNESEKYKDFTGSIVKSHIYTLVLLLIPTFILLIIFYFYTLELSYIVIGYITVVFLSVFEMCITYYRTTLRPSIVVNVNVLKSFLVVLFSAILLYFNWGIWGLLLGSLFGTSVGILIYLKKLPIKPLILLSKDSNSGTQIFFLKYGFPITLSFVLSVALQNIDKIMISSILGLEENGNYAVGFDLIHNIIYMIMTSLSLAGFPLVLKKIKKEGKQAGKELFQSYVNILLFISVPASFGFAAILNEFTELVIGDRYSISNHLMILIIIASFLHGLKSYYFDLTLQISTKTKYFFYPVLVAIVSNIIFNFFLLNKFGIEGAAFATVLAFLIAMFISSYYSIQTYHIAFPWKNFLKILVTSSLMFIIVSLITFNSDIVVLIIKLIVGIIVYTSLNILINTINIRNILAEKIFNR